jgi:hypothetical protein
LRAPTSAVDPDAGYVCGTSQALLGVGEVALQRSDASAPLRLMRKPISLDGLALLKP